MVLLRDSPSALVRWRSHENLWADAASGFVTFLSRRDQSCDPRQSANRALLISCFRLGCVVWHLQRSNADQCKCLEWIECILNGAFIQTSTDDPHVIYGSCFTIVSRQNQWHSIQNARLMILERHNKDSFCLRSIGHSDRQLFVSLVCSMFSEMRSPRMLLFMWTFRFDRFCCGLCYRHLIVDVKTVTSKLLPCGLVFVFSTFLANWFCRLFWSSPLVF